MAAAVVDFRPALAADHKLKKSEGQDAHAGRPRADPRHPQRAGRRAAAPGRRSSGFAAEHGEGALDYGRDKLRRKGLDAIVVNDISRKDIGFDAADNEVTIVTAARRDAPCRAPPSARSRARCSTRSSRCAPQAVRAGAAP